jgi:hypothetical protein
MGPMSAPMRRDLKTLWTHQRRFSALRLNQIGYLVRPFGYWQLAIREASYSRSDLAASCSVKRLKNGSSETIILVCASPTVKNPARSISGNC